MSGRRVVLLMAAGVILVTTVTLALYFLTRQLPDGDGGLSGPSAPHAFPQQYHYA